MANINKKQIFLIISFLISIALVSGNTLSSIQIANREFFLNDDLKSSLILQAKEDLYQLKILYPLSTTPSLLEKNDYLNINFESDSVDRIFAYITTAYEPVVDEIWLDFDNIIEKNSYWEAM